MALTLNIYHVQAKLTSYLDLQDYLRAEIAGGQGETKDTINMDTLTKIINHLLANEDKWLAKENNILYEIADNIVHKHYSQY
jgi:hypothetical protein